MRINGVKYRWRELFQVVRGVLAVLKDPDAADRVTNEIWPVIEGARGRQAGLNKG